MENTHLPSQLTTKQTTRFFKLWLTLLKFANDQNKIVVSIVGNDFRQQGVDHKHVDKISGYLWSHPEVFDEFLDATKFGDIDRDLVKSWQKHHYSDKFYLIKYQKDGAIFMSTGKNEKSYLIKALTDSFEEMWPKNKLPLIIETTLLPFEGEITTSGIYQTSNLIFGRSITQEINENCQKSQLTYGLIKSLPHEQVANKTDKYVAWLKFYLLSSKNMEMY